MANWVKKETIKRREKWEEEKYGKEIEVSFKKGMRDKDIK